MKSLIFSRKNGYEYLMTLGHTSIFVQFLCSFGRVQVVMHWSEAGKGLFCNSEAEENRAPIWQIAS